MRPSSSPEAAEHARLQVPGRLSVDLSPPRVFFSISPHPTDFPSAPACDGCGAHSAAAGFRTVCAISVCVLRSLRASLFCVLICYVHDVFVVNPVVALLLLHAGRWAVTDFFWESEASCHSGNCGEFSFTPCSCFFLSCSSCWFSVEGSPANLRTSPFGFDLRPFVGWYLYARFPKSRPFSLACNLIFSRLFVDFDRLWFSSFSASEFGFTPSTLLLGRNIPFYLRWSGLWSSSSSESLVFTR